MSPVAKRRAAVPEAAASPPPRGAVAAVWVTLAILLVARAALAFVPTMWAWSLNLHRFVTPWIGWGLWALAAAAAVPAVASRLAPLWGAVGEALHRRPALSTFVAALLGGTLVWALPDRVRFVGDFLLRQGTVEVSDKPSLLFPQALPLDVLLHYTLPTYLASSALVDANGAARLVGVLEAGALAALAVALARSLALRGGAALAVACTVFFGGYLGMFTGFSKAFAEMCVAVACVATFGLRALREGKGLLPLGIVVGVAVSLHRSALGFLPAMAFVWAEWLRTHGRTAAWRRASNLAGMAFPIAALGVMVPRIVAVVERWDVVHFAPATARAQGGILAAAFAGTRPADFLALLLLLAPLSPLIGVLGIVLGRRAHGGASGKEAALFWLLALPFVVVMPFLHPVQGLVRDWDDFAATGVALSVLAGWYVATALRGAGKSPWIAVTISLSALAPAVEWLAHNADMERGFQRVRALMREPPPREKSERGNTWDYLGIRYFRLERWDLAAEALANAAETSPSPRILQEWALVETMRGGLRQAQSLYHRMLAKSPENPLGWLGLATVSFRAGDLAESERAAKELLRLQPGNPDALRVLEEITRRAAEESAASAPR